MKTWKGYGWSLLLWSALCTRVLAQQDTAQEAFEAFQKGVEASQAEHWQEARAYFMKSREAFEKPSTLFNLAVANLELGLAEEALEALDAFDRSASPDSHREMIIRAHSLRKRARELLRSQPEPPAARPRPEPDTATNEPPTVPTGREAAVDRTPVGRALVGTAAALAAAIPASAFWWRDRNQSADECVSPCDNADRIDLERRLAIGTTVSLSAAALAMAIGGVTLLVRDPAEGSRPERSLSIRWSPGGGAVRLRF